MKEQPKIISIEKIEWIASEAAWLCKVRFVEATEDCKESYVVSQVSQ